MKSNLSFKIQWKTFMNNENNVNMAGIKMNSLLNIDKAINELKTANLDQSMICSTSISRSSPKNIICRTLASAKAIDNSQLAQITVLKPSVRRIPAL
ncbi:hypothetical protein WICPIJ_001126 [Wickerhamomyces pijperi]|uniref:Uncharacterized protein n=1 Tax=Wickerhamomyces pijperi TaxID=599730 RepID=A0A9P8QEQ2_WICPI|nr:hypothetical protein WICPIJ_001126 [Wickerhamomyces pijperi]